MCLLLSFFSRTETTASMYSIEKGILIVTICCACNNNKPINDALFTRISSHHTGITFINSLSYDESFNVYLYKSFYNGAGVGIGDVNNDDLPDVFFAGNQVDNALYLNRGDFRFLDCSETAGISSRGSWCTGVSMVDINADGWLDIYITKSGPPNSSNRRNQFFIHTGQVAADGSPRYVDKAKEMGLADLGFSVHASFLDYDRDGDLDLYLLNNSISPSDIIHTAQRSLREKRDPNGGNKLYRNDEGVFIDVSKEAGIYGSAIGFGLGVAVGDINRDRWPDIYVANDFFERDYLYINQGDGTFTESLDTYISESSLGAMGVDIADLNNDAYPDIFVTEMLPANHQRYKTKAKFDTWETYDFKLNNGYHHQFPRNSMQINRGPCKNREMFFSEISRLSNTSATDWSWGAQIVDFDYDGMKEIFITNGIVKDLLDQDFIDFYNNPKEQEELFVKEGSSGIRALIDKIPSEPVANYLFKCLATLQYEDVSENWGLADPGFSTGSAYGDLDRDGDLDLVVHNNNGPPFIYRNNTTESTQSNWIGLDLAGRSHNINAIGAQVTVFAGTDLYFQEVYPCKSTMSCVEAQPYIGLGDHPKIDSILIQWPDYGDTTIYAPTVNTIHRITEDASSEATLGLESDWHPFFVEVADTNWTFPLHLEERNLDFNRSQLLFESISNEGPAVAMADVDGDDQIDLFIGGGAGHSGQLLLSSSSGWIPSKQNPFEKDAAAEDTDAVFCDIDNDNDLDLLVAGGSYEMPPNSFALLDRVYLNDGRGNFVSSNESIPPDLTTPSSCIRPTDIDNDGDLDLFVGTRFIPATYGAPASSYLLINDGLGRLTDVTSEQAPDLIEVGMVTDAAWFDYDTDGDEDLLLATEWSALKILENVDGSLVTDSTQVELMHRHGLWHSLDCADLDGDGDEDFVAGNHGLNTFFKKSTQGRLRLYINDFDQNGSVDHLIAIETDLGFQPIATKKDLISQMPFLAKKISIT